MSKLLLGPLNVVKLITFDPLHHSFHIFSLKILLMQLAALADLGSGAVADMFSIPPASGPK